MSWITITEDDVKTRLTGAELSAFRTAALAAGQTDPLPEVIAQVTDEVRGYIAACPRNSLGAAGTIPKRLLGAALNIIRYRVATRLPSMKALIDGLREGEYKDALTLLRQVAACDYAIEDPTASDEQGVSVRPMIKSRRRQFSRAQQEGV